MLDHSAVYLTCMKRQEEYRSRLSGECFQDLVCPERCRCEGTVVDCSNLKLTAVPPHIPEHTTDLHEVTPSHEVWCGPVIRCKEPLALFAPDHGAAPRS
ncbi:hypothetical protein CRUP_034693, partial [Coryphaenoides rupestris]